MQTGFSRWLCWSAQFVELAADRKFIIGINEKEMAGKALHPKQPTTRFDIFHFTHLNAVKYIISKFATVTGYSNF